MQPVYIVSAARTPIGKFGGTLLDFTAADLGVIAAKAALDRAGVKPEQVEETIFGNARQAGGGPNVARQISYRSGVPETAPAYTVNKACASGLKCIALGFQEILLGNADCVLAGGTESMSRLPYYVEGARWGMRLGNQTLVDAMYRDGFSDPLSKLLMGETAEKLAQLHGISREEQDCYAHSTQLRAEAATREGRFRDEMIPVEVKTKKGTQQFDADEHIRFGSTLEGMAKLPSVFSKTGTVTAGNSSGITDGAAATVLVSERKVKEWGLQPLARIVDYTTVGVDPSIMGIGPVPAVRKLLPKLHWTLESFGLIELNEAFAAQVLACDRELHFDRDKLNVNGGAIALGHPIGCTGARIVVTLLHAMRQRGVGRGLATLCVSGGLGMAMAFEAA
ncbi:MAG: acetyl-CoA acetyltransferase [Acidobacteria bacterium RIFCSPLOWO2_02_FULL_61_28]|nr:MAG: acetyl-CoA acetyltransferase [Acidobacteria bacterium RIFCSPLOWO2_02_FULL_61_28]